MYYLNYVLFTLHLYYFQYPFEALFRSEQYALVDNGCREYLFLTEFFMVQGTQAQDLFNQILGKTLNLLVVSTNIYHITIARNESLIKTMPADASK